jgi:hypothetical protein
MFENQFFLKSTFFKVDFQKSIFSKVDFQKQLSHVIVFENRLIKNRFLKMIFSK